MSLSSKLVMTGVVTLMLCACGKPGTPPNPTPTAKPDNTANHPMLERAKEAVTPEQRPDVKEGAANETRNQMANNESPDMNGDTGMGDMPSTPEVPAEPTPFGAPDEATPAPSEPPSA